MEFVFWLKLAGLFPLFALSLIGPGWPIVRKMRWSPGEKLCASIGASLFLTYLATFIVFLVHWPVQVHWILFAIEAGLTVWYGNEIGQVLRRPFLKKALIYWVVVIAWMFTALLLIRHFSGGLWAGDWWVHARKQAILLSGQIPDYSIASWLLIERPPLMNMAAAHFMAMLGGRFEFFEAAFTLLNSLIVIPCFFIADRFASRGRRHLVIVLALFLANPMLMVNATYTWNKLLAGFYIILGIWLYLRAHEKCDATRLIAAFCSIAGGCLTHYLTVPYALVIGGHFIVTQLIQPRLKWKHFLLAGALSTVLLATWFGWVFAYFGPNRATGANATISYYSHHTLNQNVMRVLRNIRETFIPHPFRSSPSIFHQPDPLGFLRDYFFLMYQSNLFVAGGIVGGFVIAVLGLRKLGPLQRAASRSEWSGMICAVLFFLISSFIPPFRDIIFDLLPSKLLYAMAVILLALACGMIVRRFRIGLANRSWEASFWRTFILLVPAIAIVGHDAYTEFGLAHIFLHPMIFIGLVFLGVQLPQLRAWLRSVVILGMVIDYLLGIALQLHLENRTFQLAKGAAPQTLYDPGGLAPQAAVNYAEQKMAGYVFLGDHAAPLASMLQLAMALGFATVLFFAARHLLCLPLDGSRRAAKITVSTE